MRPRPHKYLPLRGRLLAVLEAINSPYRRSEELLFSLVPQSSSIATEKHHMKLHAKTRPVRSAALGRYVFDRLREDFFPQNATAVASCLASLCIIFGWLGFKSQRSWKKCDWLIIRWDHVLLGRDTVMILAFGTAMFLDLFQLNTHPGPKNGEKPRTRIVKILGSLDFTVCRLCSSLRPVVSSCRSLIEAHNSSGHGS